MRLVYAHCLCCCVSTAITALMGSCGQDHPNAVAAASTSPVTLVSPPALDPVGELRFDAGTVKSGTAVRHEFSFINPSPDTVEIASVDVSCGCMAYDVSTRQVAPGEVVTVTVVMDTRGALGLKESYANIYVNPRSPVRARQVTLLCKVDPETTMYATPTVVDFGSIDRNSKPHAAATISVAQSKGGTLNGSISIAPYDHARVDVRTDGSASTRNGSSREAGRNVLSQQYEFQLPNNLELGHWEEVVRFTYAGAGQEVGETQILLRGEVYAAIAIEPRSVAYTGLTVGQPIQREIRVQWLLGSPAPNLSVKPSVRWIKGQIAENILTLTVTPPVAASTFDEWIDLAAESGEQVRIPIFGVVE